LALTHYRVLLFGVIFIPAYAVLNIQALNSHKFFKKTFWTGVGSLFLFTPWMVSFVAGNLPNSILRLLSTPPDQITQTINALRDLNYLIYLPGWAWISLPLSVGWGIWQRNKGVAIVSLWWFFTLIAANPTWLNLPGEGLLSHGAVITGFYIPAGILIGFVIGFGINRLVIQKLKWGYPEVFAIIILLGAWGTLQRREDIVHEAIDVTRPDLNAMQWITENTPPDAKFLVNATSIFGTDSWFVGTDAGWWIPLLAHRESTTKQMLYNTETENKIGTRKASNQLTRLVIDKGLIDPEVLLQLDNQDITHVYIGRRKNDILGIHTSVLQNEPDFKAVYQQDRVWMFERILHEP